MIPILLTSWVLVNVVAVLMLAGFGVRLKRQPLDQDTLCRSLPDHAVLAFPRRRFARAMYRAA